MRPSWLAAAGVANLDVRDAVDVSVGRRIEQDVLNHAEDRGGAADAERQREHRDDREAGPCDEPAQAVADVLPHVLQHVSP